MAKKMATKEQIEVMKRNRLNPLLYVVIKDLQYSMIVKNRETGDYMVLEK